MKKQIIGWLKLLRTPNLFTVPGDVVLGFVIGGGVLLRADLPLAMVSILCLYSFGLITNDLADYAEDALKRPDRPLPSGDVSKKSAKSAAIIMLVIALVAAMYLNIYAFFVALALTVFILFYNFLFKKDSMFGPFSVALCRVLSLFFGYSAASGSIRIQAFPPMLYIVCFTWLLYFFAVSLAAYYETEPDKPVRGRFMLLMIPVVWLSTAPVASGALLPVVIMKESNPTLFLALAATSIFSIFILKNCIILSSVERKKGIIGKSIGELIGNIIFLQAAGCAFVGFPYLALGIFVLSLPARMSAKKIYGS